MYLKVAITVNLDDGSYEVEMGDTEGRLTESRVPQAIAVVAQVLNGILSGHAHRVNGDSPVLAAPAPSREGFEN